MGKAHFVNPPFVVSRATPNQKIVVSADIENIGELSEHVLYMTVWDSEADYVMSRAEAFVEPGKIVEFNCFFTMPNRDLWVDIIAGHYKDESPGWQDDEVFGAKIEISPTKITPLLLAFAPLLLITLGKFK